MVKNFDLAKNDVIQLKPEISCFGGCLAIVSEVKPWGAQVYCSAPGEVGLAYFRAKWEDMQYVGKATWAMED